jgi:protein ImuB
MPVAEAKSLFPKLTIATYDPSADRRALEELAAACEPFSPCVALEEGDAPECLLLDISNLEHLWGSEAQLTERVRTFVVGRGWRVRTAVADTVGMAWGRAHFQVDSNRVDQETGRHGDKEGEAEDLSPRRGGSATCLPVSLSPCLSSHLPIESLRIPPDTAALLRQLGIETIAQLLALPREELTSRFGEALLQRIDQWTGAAPEVLTPCRPPDPLVVRYEFEHPTGDCYALAHVVGQLAEQLAARLAARDEGALLLACDIGCVGGETTPLAIGLFEASANARQWRELIGLHLENARFSAEIARVTLRAALAGRLNTRQGELFTDGWPRDPHAWALLVNRLSSRLGGEHVLRAELRESALPERAVRWRGVTERSRVESRESRARKGRGLGTGGWGSKRSIREKLLPSPQPPASSPRPLLLYPNPQPLEVTCVAPNGPPQFVWWRERREQIAQHWGPERIETLWWRGPSVRRDYYRVALATGGHLWLFRRLADGRWFLHGVFT